MVSLGATKKGAKIAPIDISLQTIFHSWLFRTKHVNVCLKFFWYDHRIYVTLFCQYKKGGKRTYVKSDVF